MTLNDEQKAILEHTMKVGQFCGDSKDMHILCNMGLMRCLGKKSFVPDLYFAITPKGRLELQGTQQDEGNHLAGANTDPGKCPAGTTSKLNHEAQEAYCHKEEE